MGLGHITILIFMWLAGYDMKCYWFSSDIAHFINLLTYLGLLKVLSVRVLCV